MKWKFSVFTVDIGENCVFKHFANYNEAIDYAFHCEDDPNIVHVAINIITKGDYLDNE